MSLISGDPSKDIFEQNPEIEYISAIRDFIKKHGGKKKASKLLWACYMVEDPNSRIYKTMDQDERRKEVADNYLKEPKFDWKEFEPFLDDYGRLCLTKEEVFFKIWGQKIDELQVYLKTTDIAENTDQVLKVLEKIPKILQGYEDTKKVMIASNKKSKNYGNKVESISESGII